MLYLRSFNRLILISLALFSAPAAASSLYWSLFNIEGESSISADYVTYGSATDMFNDSNRLEVFTPNPGGFGRNIVGSGSDGSLYWSLFNIEGESSISADYVTYGSATDMFNDSNRLEVFTPNPGGFGRNIVGSGSDGSLYWSLFNIEGESSISADYVTYGSATDMFNDSNRLDVFTPNPGGFGRNIVGSGSDGSLYWSLFNIEGESSISADYVTYGSATDMFNDSNRLDVFTPNPGGFGRNIVGSGSIISPVPVPAAVWLFGTALLGLIGFGKRRKAV